MSDRIKQSGYTTGLPNGLVPTDELRRMLPADEWLRLNISPTDIVTAAEIHRKWDARMYRLWLSDGRQKVLKLFISTVPGNPPGEILAYELFSEYHIPVLPFQIGRRTVLMEDLLTSRTWRLAGEDDLGKASVGTAVGKWYRALHAAGARLVNSGDQRRALLHWEHEIVNETSLAVLCDSQIPEPTCGWEWAADSLARVIRAIGHMQITLNYNDFHWSNLALSRDGSNPEACLFDFHLFGLGMAYSDVRNVIGCLQGPAINAFLASYGQVSQQERILDAPVAILSAVLFGLKQSRLPRWMTPLLDELRGGQFETKLRTALSLANDILGE